MDTIKIVCPHCKEEMQAPADRDAILCMFCGGKIELKKQEQKSDAAEDPQAREKVFGKLFEMLNHMDDLFVNSKQQVRDFNRHTYADLFTNFKSKNYGFYESLMFILANAPADQKASIMKQIADGMIKVNKKTLEGLSKFDRRTGQMDINMFMAIYVLPLIKDIHTADASTLADVICKEWGLAFENSNIVASDYDSIDSGFKRKLCYITTAVCENLQLGDDCEELRLIRNFRDGWLLSSEGGKELVAEYYDIAPTMVKRIDRQGDSVSIYRSLWENYIRPCVAFIRGNQPEKCKETYCSMVYFLKQKYMEEWHG